MFTDEMRQDKEGYERREVWHWDPTRSPVVLNSTGLRDYVGRKGGRQEGDVIGQDSWSQNEKAFNTTSKTMESF